MANFLKGLAGGLETGARLGALLQEKEERDRIEELRKAAPTESQGYTAAQGRQLEALVNSGGYDIVPQYAPPAEGQTQGLFTGYQSVPKANLQDQASWDMPAAPQTYAPQRVTDFLGQRYEGGLAPERMETIRTRAMANAVADPRLRQQMLLAVTAEERAQEAELRAKEDQAYQQRIRPTQQKALEQQTTLGGIQLTVAEREAEKVKKYDEGLAEINKKEFEKPEERTQALLSLIESTRGVEAAQKLKSSYSADELNQISIQSKKFDEGFRQSRAKGVIPALEWFDEQNTSFKLERDPKNPFRYIQINQDGTRSIFADAKNERELGMIIDAKAKPGGFLELAKYDLDVRRTDASVSLAGVQAKALKDRSNAEKMGGTQYFTGQDGNMYAATPVFSQSGGLKFETTQVNPNNIKFQKPGTEKDSKPIKVEEEGTKVTIDGQLRVADGLGKYIDPKGVLPSERLKALQKSNIPDDLSAELPWNQNGTAVGFGGKAYDVRNPADMKALKTDYERLGRNTIEVEESQKKIPRQQTGLRYDPYGASQRPRMGATQEEVNAFNARKAREALNRGIAQSQTDLYNTRQYGLE